MPSLAPQPCSNGLSRVYETTAGVLLLLGNRDNAAAAIDGTLPDVDVAHVICVTSGSDVKMLRRRAAEAGKESIFEVLPMEDRLSTGKVVDIANDIREQLDAVERAVSDASARAGRTDCSGRPAVLVHCTLGVNRSPTLVLAYLVQSGLTLRQAYQHVLQARHTIDPLPGYREALRVFEVEVRGGSSTVAGTEPFAKHVSELMQACADNLDRVEKERIESIRSLLHGFESATFPKGAASPPSAPSNSSRKPDTKSCSCM